MCNQNNEMPTNGAQSMSNRFKKFVNGIITTIQKIIINRPHKYTNSELLDIIQSQQLLIDIQQATLDVRNLRIEVLEQVVTIKNTLIEYYKNK